MNKNVEGGTVLSSLDTFRAKERAHVLDGSSIIMLAQMQQVWQWLAKTCHEQWS